MPAEAFEQHKKALAVERSVKPKTLAEECGRYWRELQRSEYHFNRGKLCVYERERERVKDRGREGEIERETILFLAMIHNYSQTKKKWTI